jgi:hypothetical protein
VLGEADLARLGFQSPGTVDDTMDFCRWQTAPTAQPQAVMYFLPDVWRRYEHLEEGYRNEETFRTLTIAGRPAFLEDERKLSGTQSCQIWVSVPSGGTIQFENAYKTAGAVDESCSHAADIAATIAERVQ